MVSPGIINIITMIHFHMLPTSASRLQAPLLQAVRLRFLDRDIPSTHACSHYLGSPCHGQSPVPIAQIRVTTLTQKTYFSPHTSRDPGDCPMIWYCREIAVTEKYNDK